MSKCKSARRFVIGLRKPSKRPWVNGQNRSLPPLHPLFDAEDQCNLMTMREAESGLKNTVGSDEWTIYELVPVVE